VKGVIRPVTGLLCGFSHCSGPAGDARRRMVACRGMKERNVEQVAGFIAEVLEAVCHQSKLHAIRDKVFAFNRAFLMLWKAAGIDRSRKVLAEFTTRCENIGG